MTSFDVVWQRIVALQGEQFRQKTGRPFRYRVVGTGVVPGTTSRVLPRSHFARAFDRVPLRGPAQLQDLQGPSYLFAILTDARVVGNAQDAGAAPGGMAGHNDRGPGHRPATARPAASSARRGSQVEPAPMLAQPSGVDWLRHADPRRALLVICCSAAKARGRQPPPRPDGQQDADWPQPLRQARARVLAAAQVDDRSGLLPAWQRYQGGFYRSAHPALAEAVAAGNLVIISGGYGVVRAQEPIAWYDKVLRLADWPPGLLESALTGQARQAGADTVVAFAARTGEYARLLRRIQWRDAGLRAWLVTITGVADGAVNKVPRLLGMAFAAFWNQQHDSYPPGTAVEALS